MLDSVLATEKTTNKTHTIGEKVEIIDYSSYIAAYLLVTVIFIIHVHVQVSSLTIS